MLFIAGLFIPVSAGDGAAYIAVRHCSDRAPFCAAAGCLDFFNAGGTRLRTAAAARAV